MRCFSHAVLFVPHHKNNNYFHQLFFFSSQNSWNSKKKNRHDGIFFLQNLKPTGTTSLSSCPRHHNAAPPTAQRGPAPFHTSAFSWAIPPFRLLRSCLQQENVLPKEGKQSTQHARLAAVDSIFRDGICGSAVAIVVSMLLEGTVQLRPSPGREFFLEESPCAATPAPMFRW